MTTRQHARSGQKGLERKRKSFLAIGFITSLSLSLIAFEWKSPVGKLIDLGDPTVGSSFEPDIFVVDIIKDKKKPEITEVKKKTDPNKLKVVDNEHKETKTIFTTPDTLALDLADMTFKVDKTEEIPNVTVYHGWQVEKQASFPGGKKALDRFLQSELHYPARDMDRNQEGTVYVTFVVEPDGQLTNIAIVDSPQVRTKDMEMEAARAVKKLPRWIPAEHGGKKVRMQCSLPILFRLR
ncbi:MAG: TonB family protein [Flavobacteriales bacterium]|nr:TonB family protein [Flavobacteriales bacterium]